VRKINIFQNSQNTHIFNNIIEKYKHKKSGKIYNVISKTIINATNKNDGKIMILYEGEKSDGSGIGQFVRELEEFVIKFESYNIT
jgi:hypothetical protein